MSASLDPQPEDFVLATINGKKVGRRVISRDGGNITYRDSRYNQERTCWISTWIEWCQRNHVVE